jgi:hypothetical protein
MGDITMTDSESWKERRNPVARYRAMEQEPPIHSRHACLEAELKLPMNMEVA